MATFTFLINCDSRSQCHTHPFLVRALLALTQNCSHHPQKQKPKEDALRFHDLAGIWLVRLLGPLNDALQMFDRMFCSETHTSA
jgi:hypothetical protein